MTNINIYNELKENDTYKSKRVHDQEILNLIVLKLTLSGINVDQSNYSKIIEIYEIILYENNIQEKDVNNEKLMNQIITKLIEMYKSNLKAKQNLYNERSITEKKNEKETFVNYINDKIFQDPYTLKTKKTSVIISSYYRDPLAYPSSNRFQIKLSIKTNNSTNLFTMGSTIMGDLTWKYITKITLLSLAIPDITVDSKLVSDQSHVLLMIDEFPVTYTSNKNIPQIFAALEYKNNKDVNSTFLYAKNPFNNVVEFERTNTLSLSQITMGLYDIRGNLLNFNQDYFSLDTTPNTEIITTINPTKINQTIRFRINNPPLTLIAGKKATFFNVMGNVAYQSGGITYGSTTYVVWPTLNNAIYTLIPDGEDTFKINIEDGASYSTTDDSSMPAFYAGLFSTYGGYLLIDDCQVTAVFEIIGLKV